MQYPSFCPIHKGKPTTVCTRKITCEQCQARYVDSYVDPEAKH